MSITDINEAATRKEQKTWPQECLDSQERFGHRGARLYPLIEEFVSTPDGAGTLKQVIAGQARVLLKSEVKRASRHQSNSKDRPGEGSAPEMSSFLVQDVTPYNGWMA